MKYVLYGAILLVVLGVGGLFHLARESQSGAAAGLVQGRLAPCPSSPNCVSSEATAPDEKKVDPLPGSVWGQLPAMLVEMGGTVRRQDATYVAAEFTSSTFEFVDDVEFRLAEDAVHVRSASRVGYSDRGVNRARVAALRERLGTVSETSIGCLAGLFRASGRDAFISMEGGSPMKIGKGVEWAAHTCALLALLPPGAALPGEALADFLGVPPPYLAKQLQALSRAGIVTAKRGAAGGYRLARPPESLSLWDVTAAIEGTSPSFRCTEVRRSGPCGASPAECSGPCPIAAAFQRAEAGYRQALAAVPLTDVVAAVAQDATSARKQRIVAWVQQHATRPA